MKIKNSVILLLLFAFSAFAQQNETDRAWNQPVEPFRIIGNIYYVGASEITAFLIATPKGHFLLDGGYAETVPQIKENVAKLGFKIEDVKFFLNSQAHYDHAGGLAELKRLTGAKMLASAEDKILLENGGKGDFHFGDTLPFEPVKVDKIIRDNEKINLGGANLTALITPGHTIGCTTWTTTVTENKRKYNVVFVCSTTVPGYNLVDNKNYPNIVRDYNKTFERLKKLDVDVFLAAHGNFFDLEEKSKKIRTEREPNPFVDPKKYREFIERTEKQFRERLEKQKEESRKR